jgi:hypothetical protein
VGNGHRALRGPAHPNGLVLKPLQEHVGERSPGASEGPAERLEFRFEDDPMRNLLKPPLEGSGAAVRGEEELPSASPNAGPFPTRRLFFRSFLTSGRPLRRGPTFWIGPAFRRGPAFWRGPAF